VTGLGGDQAWPQMNSGWLSGSVRRDGRGLPHFFGEGEPEVFFVTFLNSPVSTAMGLFVLRLV